MDLIYLVLCLLLPFTAILNPSTINIRNMLRSNLPDNKPDLRSNLPDNKPDLMSNLPDNKPDLRSNLPDNKPDLRCRNDNLPTSQGNILSFLS